MHESSLCGSKWVSNIYHKIVIQFYLSSKYTMDTITLLILVFFAVWFINKITAPAGESFSAPSQKIVTLYYADWCPHCQTIKPIWQRVKADYGSQVIFRENDEAQRKTPGIESIPTIIIENNGKKSKYDGGADYNSLRNWILGFPN